MKIGAPAVNRKDYITVLNELSCYYTATEFFGDARKVFWGQCKL